MHAEAWDFLERVKRHLPDRFRGQRVLEAGSYDVNGSPRRLFDRCQYVGIDQRAGPGVDRVGRLGDFGLPRAAFDVGISTETLEHDPDWRLTLVALLTAVRPGGLVLVTCASFERPAHGLEFDPTGHYRNVQPVEVRPFIGRVVLWEEDAVAGDLHAAWFR